MGRVRGCRLVVAAFVERVRERAQGVVAATADSAGAAAAAVAAVAAVAATTGAAAKNVAIATVIAVALATVNVAVAAAQQPVAALGAGGASPPAASFVLMTYGDDAPEATGPPVLAQVAYDGGGRLRYRTLARLDDDAGVDMRLVARRPNGVVWLYDNVDSLYHVEPRWPAATHRVEGVDVLLTPRSPWLYFFNRQPTPEYYRYGGTFHVLDMRTADVRPVVHVPEEPLSWPASWMNAASSPDGRHLALPRHTRVDVEDLHRRVVYTFSWRPPSGMADEPGRYRPVLFTRNHGLAVVAGPIAPGDKPTLEVHDVWRRCRRRWVTLPVADDGEGIRLWVPSPAEVLAAGGVVGRRGEVRSFHCLIGGRTFSVDDQLKSVIEVFPDYLVGNPSAGYRVQRATSADDRPSGLPVVERLEGPFGTQTLLALEDGTTVLLDAGAAGGRAVTLPAAGVKSYPVCWLYPEGVDANEGMGRRR